MKQEHQQDAMIDIEFKLPCLDKMIESIKVNTELD